MPFANPITAGTILVQPAIQSPNFSQAGKTGWAIKADGSAFFFNITATGTITGGTFVGTNFVINASGAFFYSGTPAFGNLILSVSQNGGTDPFGNTVEPGFASYEGSPIIVAQLFGGQASFLQEGTTNTPASVGIGGVSPTSQGLHLSSGNVIPGVTPGSLSILDANSGVVSGVPAVEVNGTLEASAASSGGQLLVIQNTTGGPSNSNAEIICQSGGDNALGIMVTGDTFNRVKVTTRAISMGAGTATQDVQLYRSSAGTWGADTILANVSGSAETWHTLGTLAGATVNVGQFRFLADGMAAMEIDVTFGVTTTVPLTFSVTIPAAYRPLGSVDVRVPMAQTNASGGLARIFVGSAGGSSAGQVQIAAFGNSVIGTYSAHFQYPVI